VGDKLPPERDLAKLFKVSRVVVREVLRSLEQSGLVEIKAGPKGGPIVADNMHKPIFDSARDLVDRGELTLEYFAETRDAIERLAVKRAAKKATTDDIDMLKEINEQLLKEVANPAEARKKNMAFHMAIAEIAGNPLLKLILQSILELLGVVFPMPQQSAVFFRKTYERHKAIITAMRKHDIEKCEELMGFDAKQTTKLAVK
jgi:DNA-binding FadR family transcriptional regulator